MKAATWLILCFGIALRVTAWSQRSSLWLDEVALALNVNGRSLWELLAVPLDYGQAAPRGFLLLQWCITNTVGGSDLAFRLLPFVAGVASLFLFRRVALRVLSATGAAVALLYFAFGFWFIFFSADAKPYGLDLTLSLLMLELSFDFRESSYDAAKRFPLAAAGFVSVLLSNATVITLAGLGVALGVVAVRDRGGRTAVTALWPAAAAWAAGSTAALWLGLHLQFPGMVEYLHRSSAWLFPPTPHGLGSLLWFVREWRAELGPWHGWALDDSRWTLLLPALAGIGLCGILSRRRSEGLLLAAPIVAFMVAALAQQYPYGVRFALFPLALLLLGVGESVDRVSLLSSGRAQRITRGLAALLCVPPLYFVLAYPPPYPWSAVGSYLGHIRSHWKTGDVLIVTYGRALEVMYHAPRIGIAPHDLTFAPCDFVDERAGLRAVDALRGHSRVWAIVDGGAAFPPVEYAYLRTIGMQSESLAVQPRGTRRLTVAEPYDIETAYRFDLSDSTRLARATAATYRRSPWLSRQTNAARAWQCRGVFSAATRESARYRRKLQ